MKPLILGAAIGSCVHIAGLHHFLMLAQAESYATHSLGAAVQPLRLIDAIESMRPSIVAVSYRLTPEVAARLFADIADQIHARGIVGTRFIFGGTPPVAEAARASGLFERVFTGNEGRVEIIAYLRGQRIAAAAAVRSHDLLGRIAQKFPYPLIRHHYGEPSLEGTLAGAAKIAEAGVLDVLSIGTDQNAQEHFFRPSEMQKHHDGAGGVPIRQPDHLRAIFAATRRGNFPLLRCYSGTRDLVRWAEMSVDTIENAWAAIPLCWYSILDGRSSVPLREAIAEKQDAMRWYAAHSIPVEVNESHQWSLRDAHDALAVAMAFLAGYNAKKAGVRWYIAQLMLNTPPGTTPIRDLAKMLAKLTLLGRLEDDTFTVYREVRPGIAHFSSDAGIAKGQGAASIALGMTLRPHIVHAVSFSEGDHATTADELIESCMIAHGAVQNALEGAFDPYSDDRIAQRRDELVRDADLILNTLRGHVVNDSRDPWTDASVLAAAIESGLLDAPHFRGNPALCGKITTACINGAWHPVNPLSGAMIPEIERIASLAGEIGAARQNARESNAPVSLSRSEG